MALYYTAGLSLFAWAAQMKWPLHLYGLRDVLRVANGCHEGLLYFCHSSFKSHTGWFYRSSSVSRSHISYVIWLNVFTISICPRRCTTLIMKLYNIVVRLLSLCLCVQWSVVISFRFIVVWRMLLLLLLLLLYISVFTNIMSVISTNEKVPDISIWIHGKPKSLCCNNTSDVCIVGNY